MKLEQQLFERIVDLLHPHMDKDNRHSLITPVFFAYDNLYSQIEWSGNNKAFATKLVSLLVRYGKVEFGEESLVLLLNTLRGQIGLDGQKEIDEVCRMLELTQPDYISNQSIIPNSEQVSKSFSKIKFYVVIAVALGFIAASLVTSNLNLQSLISFFNPMFTPTITEQPIPIVASTGLTTPITTSIFPSPNIYRIKATQCIHEPTSRQLTGFHMKGKKGIITALHGVIDCNTISAVTDAVNGQFFIELSIREVDIERDVAQLSSDTLDDLPPNNGFDIVQNLDGIEDQYFKVIGYPLGLMKQNLRVNASIIGEMKLKDLIPFQYQKKLRTRNSPNPNISVLQIQTYISPGDSGAPVLNNEERVVGVINGGLEEGTAGINWLIPIKDIEWRSTLDIRDELDELQDIGGILF